MPYSRAKEKRLSKMVMWPDVRYDPNTGEPKLFQSAKDVPFGWLTRPFSKSKLNVGKTLNRDELISQLDKFNIHYEHIWCNAQLKKILDKVQHNEEVV